MSLLHIPGTATREYLSRLGNDFAVKLSALMLLQLSRHAERYPTKNAGQREHASRPWESELRR